MKAQRTVNRTAGSGLSTWPWAVACAALLSACAAGPTYVKPTVDTPVSWQLQEPWRTARPADAHLDVGQRRLSRQKARGEVDLELYRSISGPPLLFKTKREAVASFEAFHQVLIDALAGRV